MTGGQLTKASGSVHGNGDVVTPTHMFECKWSKAIRTRPTLGRDDWEKTCAQAFRQGRMPVMIIANPRYGYAVRAHYYAAIPDPPPTKSVRLRPGIHQLGDKHVFVSPLSTLERRSDAGLHQE